MIEKKQFNSAMASAILGFIGISPAAIFFGHLALSKIKKNQHLYSLVDKKMAYGGLLMGYAWSLAWLYMILIALSIYFGWDISFLFPYGMNKQ